MTKPEGVRVMSDDEYFAMKRELGAMGQSEIKEFARDPEAFHLGPITKESRAIRFGSLADSILFMPQDFKAKYEVGRYDRWQSNESKDWCTGVRENGMEPLKPSMLKEAAEVVCSVVCRSGKLVEVLFGDDVVVVRREAEHFMNVFSGKQTDLDPLLDCIGENLKGRAQVAGTCAIKGLDKPFAFKIDWEPDQNGPYGEWLFDLKMTEAFSPFSYTRRVFEAFRYHWQAYLYLGGYNMVTGQRRSRFGHIIGESSGHHRSIILPISKESLDMAADEVEQAFGFYRYCLKHDFWPGPWDGIDEIGIGEDYGAFRRYRAPWIRNAE